jgi:hypothetical protein
MAGQRIYKTNDGRHVPEGHPDAAWLAFSEFDKPPKGVLDEVEEAEEADKPKKKAADTKQRTPADK